jgi:hypothetical protein
MLHEHTLQFSHGLQLGPQALTQLGEGSFVFSWEEDLLGEEAVLNGVQACDVLPLRRFGPAAVEGVSSVGSDLLGTRHDRTFPSFLVGSIKVIVARAGWAPNRNFSSPQSGSRD